MSKAQLSDIYWHFEKFKLKLKRLTPELKDFLKGKKTVKNPLEGLNGVWEIYGWYHVAEEAELVIVKERLQIDTFLHTNTVKCQNRHHIYDQGEVKVAHSNLIINLTNSNQKHLYIIGNLGENRNILQNLSHIPCVFVASSSQNPKAGNGIMLRSNKKFEDINLKYIKENTPEFEKLKQEGILELLSKQIVKAQRS